MVSQILPPEYQAQTAIHAQVGYFVDVRYLTHACLRRVEQRQIKDKSNDT